MMAEFFIYILKWAVTLTLLYSFYGLWLRRETFHTLNRMVLLGMLVMSALLPAFHVTTTQSTVLNQSVERVEVLVLEENESGVMPSSEEAREVPVTRFSWIRLTFIIYIIGLLACWLYYFYMLGRFGLLVGRAKRLPVSEVPVWVHVAVSPNVKNSCSWFRWIVLSPADAHDARVTILTHELAHIQRGHSWDKLLCECTCRMLWFLPFVWMLRQDLADVHEFEADRAVLDTGVNLREYNELMIRKAVRSGLQPVVNAFNESKTKKRMMMMFKKKSTKLAALKVLYLLPLTAFAITAFAKPQLVEEVEEAITQAPLDIFPQEEKVVADVPVRNANTQPLTADDDSIDQEVTNVLLVIDRIPVNLDQQGNLVPLYVGKQEPATLAALQGWDAEQYALIANVDTTNIESITILKNAAANAVWGEKGRNGVVEIMTKDKNAYSQELRAGDVISGRVWTEEDSVDYVPIENAKVYEVTEQGTVVGQPATTDEAGEFRLRITNPTHKIRITHAGYSNVLASIRKRFSFYQIYPTDYFSVKAGDIVAGEVLDFKTPIPDVYIAEIDGVGNAVNYTQTDASGKFSLRIADPTHRLEGKKKNYTTQTIVIHKGNNRILMEALCSQSLR
jgi:TonB-dependent SusC/RagA subfamily outer membrane receptor